MEGRLPEDADHGAGESPAPWERADDYGVGIALVAIGIVLLLLSTLGEKTAAQLVSAQTLGPAFFPVVISMLLIVVGIGQVVVTRFFFPVFGEVVDRSEWPGSEVIVLLAVVAGGVLYLEGVWRLGLVVTTVLATVGYLLLTDYRPFWRGAVIAIVGALLLYGLLVQGLDVFLPDPLLF